MSFQAKITFLKNYWRWLLAGALLGVIGLTGMILWLGGYQFRDPLFRGQPESQWIKNLKYRDDPQVEEWKGYGEAGVRVLVRGLENADRPLHRAYRKSYPRLVKSLRSWAPPPASDPTRATRLTIVSLLASLGGQADSAIPAMIRTLQIDDADEVRQSGITFFLSQPGVTCRCNRLSTSQKRALLPVLVRDLQNRNNAGLRQNAAIALNYFPEYRELITPALVLAMRDSDPMVRLHAAEALNHAAPADAQKVDATTQLVELSNAEDNQTAREAITALGHTGSQVELAVPALLRCLQSTNTGILCEAIWALEWSPPEFRTQKDKVIPALEALASRQDHVGKYAQVALDKWKKPPVIPQTSKTTKAAEVLEK